MSDLIQSVPPAVTGDAPADSTPVQVTTADLSPPVTTADLSPPVTTADLSPPVTTADISPPVTAADISTPVTTTDISTPVTTTVISPLSDATDTTQPGEQVVEKPQANISQSSFQVGTMVNAIGNTIRTRCWKPTDSLHPR